jgi:ABC-type oligopeptide transport system substrate-binding subunit
VFGYPDAVVRDLEERYGLRGQFRRMPTLSNFMFAFNTRSPAFKGGGTAPLRKAINYVLDRPALTGKHGYLTGDVPIACSRRL